MWLPAGLEYTWSWDRILAENFTVTCTRRVVLHFTKNWYIEVVYFLNAIIIWRLYIIQQQHRSHLKRSRFRRVGSTDRVSSKVQFQDRWQVHTKFNKISPAVLQLYNADKRTEGRTDGRVQPHIPPLMHIVQRTHSKNHRFSATEHISTHHIRWEKTKFLRQNSISNKLRSAATFILFKPIYIRAISKHTHTHFTKSTLKPWTFPFTIYTVHGKDLRRQFSSDRAECGSEFKCNPNDINIRTDSNINEIWNCRGKEVVNPSLQQRAVLKYYGSVCMDAKNVV